jgi:hypothetical protein
MESILYAGGIIIGMVFLAIITWYGSIHILGRISSDVVTAFLAIFAAVAWTVTSIVLVCVIFGLAVFSPLVTILTCAIFSISSTFMFVGLLSAATLGGAIRRG